MSDTSTPTKKTRKSPDVIINRELIKMEKGFPVPPEEPNLADRRRVIPVNILEIGESFSHPAITGNQSRIMGSINSAIYAEVKLHPTKRFVVRHINAESVVRCWRIADKVAE